MTALIPSLVDAIKVTKSVKKTKKQALGQKSKAELSSRSQFKYGLYRLLVEWKSLAVSGTLA